VPPAAVQVGSQPVAAPEPLPDELEHAAHDTAVNRLRDSAGGISHTRRRIPSKRYMRERHRVYS